AGGMRGVPGLRRRVVAQAHAIVVADDGRAVGTALRPVAAGRVFAAGDRAALRRGTGQHVVHVHRVAAAHDHLAALGQRGLLGRVILAVRLVDAAGDHLALGIDPRPAADAVARVDRARTRGAQVRVPRLAPGARRGREVLAVPVRAREAAEVGALARIGAG